MPNANISLTKHHLFTAMLGILGLSATAVAGPFAWRKVENPGMYIQMATHILAPADPPGGHPIVPPGVFWATPYTLGPAPAVWVGGTSQHLIALHPFPPHNEGAPGPLHAYFLANPPPPPGRVMALARLLHGRLHPDLFIEVLAANAAGAVFADLGRHDPPPGCPSLYGVATGQSEVPPTPTPAFAVTALNLHIETYSLAVGVTVQGIVREQLIGSAIHLGPEGAVGPPIFDLGPGSQWEDLDGLGIGRAIEAEFPPEYVSALLGGQTYINLRTTQYPDGEIRGQLVYPIQYSQGDMNCDETVDGGDVGPFVTAAVDPAAYQSAYPECHLELGDYDGDGAVTPADVEPFVDVLLAQP